MLEQTVKKWLVILAVVALIGDIGIFTLVAKTNKTTSGLLGGGITLDKYYLDGGGYTATTTPKYILTSTASSTLTMSVSNAKHIDLNVNLTASTTSTVLYWTNYFSSDDGSNKNWYPETGYTATSNVLRTEGASPLIHVWTPADSVSSTTRKNIGVEPVASKYMRTYFWVGGDNAALYVEGITQSDVNQ